MNNIRIRRPPAFTLIELMIVVIIIAALAAMVLPRLSGRSEEAKIAIAQADISSNIAMALKLYDLDNGNYPATEQGLAALLIKSSSSPVPLNWKGPYLEKKSIDPWKNPYQYKCPGEHNPSTYDLYSLGKDGVEGTADDVKNWE
ncbi:MAG: type II secretion system major pseudopilin GspG [Candidatus Omnitrophota bacterium]|nr:type II secretion system major pseudopilin GspG [Candidatus Omnitrophota bacterium]